MLNGKNGLQLLFKGWELILDDGSLLHLLMLKLLLLQELLLEHLLLNNLLLLLGHLINVLHVVLLHLVVQDLLLLLHLLNILLLLLGVHEYLRRRHSSLDDHLRLYRLLLLLHLRRILRHLVKELLLLNLLLVHKLAGLVLELLLKLVTSNRRRELLLENDLLRRLRVGQRRWLVESLLLLLRNWNSSHQLRNLQLHRLWSLILHLTLLLSGVHLLSQHCLLLQCLSFLLQLNLPCALFLLLQHCLNLNLQYLGHRLRVVLHQDSTLAHFTGNLVRIVQPRIKVKLNRLVLLVLVNPLLRVQNPQPELHPRTLRIRDKILLGNRLQPDANVLAEELTVQQLLTRRPSLLLVVNTPLDNLPHLRVFHLFQTRRLYARSYLLVNLRRRIALVVRILTRRHLQHAHPERVNVHRFVVVLLVHLRRHKLRRPDHRLGKAAVLERGQPKVANLDAPGCARNENVVTL